MCIAGVSYVVPARNEAGNVGRAVRSILSQRTAMPIEVLVVDNGSTDATGEVARAAGARVITSNAVNAASARNDGARTSSGDLLCFIDADCTVAPDHLARVLAALAGGASAVGARCLVPENASRIQRAWVLQTRARQARDVSWLPSANFSVRRAAFEDVAGFDESLQTCEDSDIGYRLIAKGHRIRSDPCIVVVHFRAPATFSEFVVKETWRGRDSLRSFIRHGCPLRELPSLVYPLVVVGAPVAGGVAAAGGATRSGPAVAVLGVLIPLLAALRTSFRQGDLRSAGTLSFLYWGWAVARFAALARETYRLPGIVRGARAGIRPSRNSTTDHP